VTLAAALLALLGLAACASATASPGTARARPHVRIGGFAAGAGSVAIVMEKLGVFDRAGIDAEFVIFPDSTVATSALVGGQIDYLVASNDRPVINAEAGGPPFQMVMGLAQRPPWTWVVHPDTPVHPGDPIAALKGMVIGDGGPNTTQRYAERFLLSQAGLDPDRDVQFRVMPQDAATATAAFERHDVDVLSAIEPTTSTLLSRTTGRVYIDLRAPDSPVAFASKESLVARTGYIATNGDLVGRVVVAVCHGVSEARSDPGRVARLLADYYQTEGLAVGRRQRDQMLQGVMADSARWGGQIDRVQWTRWEALLERQGLVRHHYEYEQVVATQYAADWTC
jgi:ABC-type nitrate/sulfonate/bicarbonate transport system substrate-binding protein